MTTEHRPDRPRGAPSAAIAAIGPDSWTEPFWAAAHEHRLVAARCAACGAFRMPPTPFCPRCLSQDTEWPELSGRGIVYSYTVVRHAVVPELAQTLPYVIALVELDGTDGQRIFSNIVQCDPDDIQIGQAVEVVFDDVGDGVTIPRFGPVTRGRP